MIYLFDMMMIVKGDGILKRAVVFYSLSGNTRKAAEAAAKQLEAELIELKPVKDMPKNTFLKFMICGRKAIRWRSQMKKQMAAGNEKKLSEFLEQILIKRN